MADTPVASGLTVAQWDDKFFMEYLTENRFSGEMGTSTNDIIQTKENLTKKPGDRMHYALVNKLTQNAVTGSAVMEGNEEKMDSRSFPVTVDKRRNAVRVAEVDEQYSAISLRQAGRAVLKDWAEKDTETLITQGLGSINGVFYGAATEAQKDAWLVDNTDRVFFASGYSGTDHSAGLAEQDSTNDLLTTADLDAMKLKAYVTADPKVRPVRVSEMNGRQYYVAYVHPLAFRDLRTSVAMQEAQREVSLAMENNRLFQGGDLLWNGIVLKEVPDMYDLLTFTGAGAGGTTTVVPVFLCGAQAVGAAYARRWKSITEEFDYGDKHGVEISAIYGIEKMRFGSGLGDTDDPRDHGVVTGYFASSTVA